MVVRLRLAVFDPRRSGETHCGQPVMRAGRVTSRRCTACSWSSTLGGSAKGSSLARLGLFRGCSIDSRAVYKVGRRDKVVPLDSLPQSDPGAPLPLVVASDNELRIAYISPGAGSEGEVMVTVTFNMAEAHMFGSPNDEAFDGHPLARRGLHPYGAFEIEDSSWISQLERMNSVHPRHSPELFEGLRHYVLSFHDTTFECVAEGFDYSTEPLPAAFTLAVSIDLQTDRITLDDGDLV